MEEAMTAMEKQRIDATMHLKRNGYGILISFKNLVISGLRI